MKFVSGAWALFFFFFFFSPLKKCKQVLLESDCEVFGRKKEKRKKKSDSENLFYSVPYVYLAKGIIIVQRHTWW